MNPLIGILPTIALIIQLFIFGIGGVFSFFSYKSLENIYCQKRLN